MEHRDQAARTARASRSRFLLPLIVGGALFMQTLDGTIIATALPTMARSLGEDPVRLDAVIIAYPLSAAVLIPISGWMADRFGARTVFRAAIAVFALSSLLCGLSQTLGQLIAARVLQGAGGAMMIPVGRVLVLRTFPKAELVRAMSSLTTPAMLGAVLGPPVGGVIVTLLSWHWVFLLNVPLGVLGLALVSRYVDDVPAVDVPPLDRPGLLLSTAAMAGLICGLESLGRGMVPLSGAVGLILFGGLCAVLYARHAGRAAHPILNTALLRIPTFGIATLGGGLCRVGLSAMPFLLAVLLQVGFGLSAITAGLLSFASAAGALFNKAAIRPITRWLGFRTLLIGTTVLHAGFLCGYGLFRASTPYVVIAGVLLAGGLVRSVLFTALNTLTYADVGSGQMANASAITSVGIQLSLSIGVGVAALLLEAGMAWNGRPILDVGDIATAFYGVGLLHLLGLAFFLRLTPDAGAEMSGHRPSPGPG